MFKKQFIFSSTGWIILLLLPSLFAFTPNDKKVVIHNPSKYYINIDNGYAASTHKNIDHIICGLPLLLEDMSRYGNPKLDYPLIERKAAQHSVGEIEKFNVIDFSGITRKVIARAERKGQHAYIYVDTTSSFKEQEIDEILNLFDNQIYPTTVDLCGSEPNPGVDGDELITILLYSISQLKNLPGYITGYIWPGNQYPTNKVPNSNQRELLYIDITRLKHNGVAAVAGTIAHEFQHLIHWNYDRNEEKWINEGLSEYTAFINGFGLSNSLSVFLNHPDISLMDWTNHPIDYVRSFLWIAYLAEHYGGNTTIRKLVTNPDTGMAAIQKILDEQIPVVTVEEVFSDWIVANYLDYSTDRKSLFGYNSIDLPAIKSTQTFNYLPVTSLVTNVNPYAADYFIFKGGENLILNVDGMDSNPFLKARIIKLKRNSAPEILNVPINNNGNGTLPLLDMGVNFEQLVLIPYAFQKTSSGDLINYKIEAEGEGGPHVFADTVQYYDQDSRTAIAFGMPSPIINLEHFDAYAVRVTPQSDGILSGAELAIWGKDGATGDLRFYVYENSHDSLNIPTNKIDSLVVQNVRIQPGKLIWNRVDFSHRNIIVKKGQDIQLAWVFENFNSSDTVFAALDTAKVATNRSSVYVRERQSWAGIENGNNLFLRAIFSIPADLSVPDIAFRILQDPMSSASIDILAVSQSRLQPSSVEGGIAIGDSIKFLNFQAKNDSNQVFVTKGVELSGNGPADLIVSARHAFGTIVGTDTLKMNINFIDIEKGGEVTSFDRNLRLNLPAHAFPSDTYFITYLRQNEHTINKNNASLDNHFMSTGLEYTISPTGLNFQKMAELTFYFHDNEIALLSENDLAIAYLNDNGWEVLGGELYRNEKSISVLVNRTGAYGLVINQFEESGSEVEHPTDFFLQQNYPNPFNSRTTIRFGLPKSIHTTIRIINLKGQIISTLIDKALNAGEHIIEWDGTDEKKLPVASGVYLYQIQAEEFFDTKKLVLVK